MAHPELDNGYLKIANELQLALARHSFTSMERRILDAVVYKTYGWHKKTDHISYTQFSDVTHIKDLRNIYRALKSLTQRNIITAVFNGSRTKVYGVQKNYDLWDIISIVKPDVVPNDVVPNDVVPNDEETIVIPDDITIVKPDVYKRYLKIQDSKIPPNKTSDKLDDSDKGVCNMLVGNTTEIIAELHKLPNWKPDNDEAWVGEILSEFPDMLTITLIRDCRDYHLETHPNKKHIWRTAIRNWIKKESAFRKEDQGKKGNSGKYKELL